MATVAAVIASTHHPFYYRASTSTGADRPPFADEWVAKIEAFRETLTRARPDVLVMVGSDHFHQIWLDNMPQFLIGKAPAYEPLRVTSVLADVDDLADLLQVIAGVGLDLLRRQARAGLIAAAGVADQGGVVADDQHRLMAQFLEQAQLAQRNRVAEMDVDAGRVDAVLDRAAACRSVTLRSSFWRSSSSGSIWSTPRRIRASCSSTVFIGCSLGSARLS